MYSKDVYGEIEMVTMYWYVIYADIDVVFYKIPLRFPAQAIQKSEDFLNHKELQLHSKLCCTSCMMTIWHH